jgi:hypothetical protein
MPEALLQILTFCLMLIVWLFLLRVIWAVWSEARAPLTVETPAPVAAATRAAPSPAAPPTVAADRGGSDHGAGRDSARLKVVEPPERRGQAFDLSDEVKIGRAGTNTVALPDDSYVSQLHARVFRRDGALYLEDLGSTNGTFLNRKPVKGPVAVKRGDRIQVGRTVLEVTR